MSAPSATALPAAPVPVSIHPGLAILVLALLLSIQPVTTDLYLPALPALTRSLGAPLSAAQLTLSGLLLAFGCSQMVWGPLSDRFGRRPVLLAGLSTVPPEIEEAAQLETKSQWLVLRYVQLPFLIPSLVAVLILRTADTLKLFDMPFTMTRGGPGAATEFIAVLIERVGNRQFDIGLASAQAIIMLALTIGLARLYIRFFYREVN